MNFCINYFKKDLYDLQEEDLKQFFKIEKKENQHLEFKQFHSRTKRTDLISIFKKAVCSFLNSEGGILIYGAPKKEKDSDGKEYYQGNLTPFPSDTLPDKDDLMRQIVDNIHSMPRGVRFELIKFEQGSIGVFEIQPSQTKPHQTENIYQIRIDGQKKPAPHYLIEAMMKQITFPEIRAYVRVINTTYTEEGRFLLISFNVLLANFSEFKNEKNVRFSLQIQGPMDLLPGNSPDQISAKRTKFFKHENLIYRIPAKKKFILKGDFGMISDSKEIKLVILFHGESSPPKATVYKFDIETRSHRGRLVNDKAKIVVDNIPLAEYQNSLGISTSESLISALKIDL
jgi:hypothetical protein